MSNLNKYKSVKVSTPFGEREIVFRPAVKDEEMKDSVSYVCDTHCPYGKVCIYLPNPMQPDSFESRFCDFCSDIADTPGEDGKDNTCLRNMVPCQGEIERAFGNDMPKLMEIIMKKNPMFTINQYIDKVCPQICDYYDKEHSMCGKDNSLCFVKGLFEGPREGILDGKHVYEMDKDLATDLQEKTNEVIKQKLEEANKKLEENIKKQEEEKAAKKSSSN